MSFYSAEGGPIWIKFRRLEQYDMSTAVIWSKSKPDVQFQYGGRLGEFHGMSSQSDVSHCRVLPLGEFTVMTYATLQGAVTWRNRCHDCATWQGVIIPSVLKIVFRHILFFVVFVCPMRCMDRIQIYLCVCVCVCVCVHPLHFLSTRLQVRPLNGFLQFIA